MNAVRLAAQDCNGMDLSSVTITTDNPYDYFGHAEDLFRQDRSEDLEKYCSLIFERFPTEPIFWRLLGWTAEKQKNWKLSSARWDMVRTHAPTDFRAHLLWLQALRRSGQSAAAAEAMALIEHSFPDADLQLDREKTEFHLQAREFTARCESIGSGCEFGLLQREAGHEPLGLLRWSSISPSGLVSGLKSKFSGIGSPEYTKLSTAEGEYYLTDNLYSIRMHTFIPVTVDAKQVIKQLARRLQFLARKLIEELELAEKVFVYKYGDAIELPVLLRSEVEEIFEALQAYGPNRMLLVEKAGVGEQPGSTARLNKRLIRGCVSKVNAYDGVNDSDYPAWTSICREAARVFG